MDKLLKTTILLITLSLAPVLANAQIYELSATGNKAVITGTSSLHDWEMDVTQFRSGIRLNREGTSVKNIENVTFSCKARDIKSENSIMNKKTYEALKADKFPEISFTGTSLTNLVSQGNSIKGTLTGKLTLAGQTHDISLPFTGTVNEKNVSINSSAEMTFSGFGMAPPTAMLGTLKTGDKVKVAFNLQYNQK
ncbi:MAG: YceI family protein [Chloroflexota bacterium]